MIAPKDALLYHQLMHRQTHFITALLSLGAESFGLLAVCFMVYWPSLHGGFIWDDHTYIISNPAFQADSPLRAIWLGGSTADYWPLSYTLFWLARLVFGDATFGYHVLGIMLHVLNAVLLRQLLLLLRAPGARLAAWLWLLHPVAVESVAWIFQIKTTLSSSLCLASGLLFLSNHEERRRRDLGAYLLFALAMLAKAAVVSAPIALGILWYWRRPRRVLPSLLLRRLIPFLAIAAILTVVNLYWYRDPPMVAPSEIIRTDGWWGRCVVAAGALWFYLYKALAPVQLAFVYPRLVWQDFGIAAALPLLALLAAGILALNSWHQPKARSLTLAMACYAVLLAPCLGFYDIYFHRYSWVADHWQYQGLMVISALIAAAVTTIRAQGLRLLVGGVLLAGLAWLSHEQSKIYVDEETIWRDTLRQNPHSWMAHNSLGIIVKRSGDPGQALVHYQAAASIFPQAQSYYNMAKVYDEGGDLYQALAFYVIAESLNPYQSAIYVNKGVVFAKLGNREAARASFLQAISLGEDATAHYNLAYLSQSEEPAFAAFHYRKALAINPRLSEAKAGLDALQKSAKIAPP